MLIIGYHPSKKKKTHWDKVSTEKLVAGVNQVGEGNWVQILSLMEFPQTFNNNILNYKWKNLKKYKHIEKRNSKWILC